MSEFNKKFHIPCECFFPPVPPPQIGPTGSTGTLSVAYGHFWKTDFITVSFEDPFSFNQAGPTVGGISLLNPTTINITQAGDYRVSFISSINALAASSLPYGPIKQSYSKRQSYFLSIYK